MKTKTSQTFYTVVALFAALLTATLTVASLGLLPSNYSNFALLEQGNLNPLIGLALAILAATAAAGIALRMTFLMFDIETAENNKQIVTAMNCHIFRMNPISAILLIADIAGFKTGAKYYC